MIDIGANLSNEQFNKDLDIVINNAVIAKLQGIILTSTNLKTYYSNLDIIDKYKNDILIKTTYGLHPHSVANDYNVFSNIDSVFNNPSVVSIGEFGLDYVRMIGDKYKQIEVMNKFLDIAHQFPHQSLFLHERGAFSDFYDLLKNANIKNKKVVHCFTGTLKEAKDYMDIDCFIGITGWISDQRRNNDLKDALNYIPLDRLMIETDCPYLTPFNMIKRPKRNEPSLLIHIAQSIADIKNISVEKVIESCTKNSLDFFSLNDYNNNIKNNQVKKI